MERAPRATEDRVAATAGAGTLQRQTDSRPVSPCIQSHWSTASGLASASTLSPAGQPVYLLPYASENRAGQCWT